MHKENFIFWLENNTPLSVSTIKKYAGAINTISVGLKKYELLEGDLYNIDDTAKIEYLNLKYFAIPEFNEKNIRGNKMYSNALKYYKKFVAARN